MFLSGGIIGAAVSCVAVSVGILVALLIFWRRYDNANEGNKCDKTLLHAHIQFLLQK